MLVLFALGIIIPAAVGRRDDGNGFISIGDGVFRVILHGERRGYGGEKRKKKERKLKP